VNPLAEFFTVNIIAVYFFYGLSFFIMGLAVLLEAGHSSELDFARALRPLAGFGLVHGGHEWFEMFLLIYPNITQNPANSWIGPLRVALLASSFLMLISFGANLIAGSTRPGAKWRMILVVVAIWGAGLLWVLHARSGEPERMIAADVYTRYSLAIPGAALTVWGLLIQRRKFIEMGLPSFGRDVVIAAAAFGVYGGIGQLFVSPSTVFPSIYLNSSLFLRWFGFPIQVLRATMATVAAIFIIRSLRAFEVETQRRIEALRNEQQAERQRLEATRAELLHRTVKAQESERQRIARELHDETGQTLTALAMGLRGLSDTLPNNTQRAVAQAQHLEKLASSGLEELQRLVGGLHPPQLDDLGLLAALRWYAGEVKLHYDLPVKVSSIGPSIELSPEVRVVLYRIAQEALTNTIRHAQADQATICLETTDEQIALKIEDDGQGFNIDETLNSATSHPSWGLLGMLERASLIGGICKIFTRPGGGTRVEVRLPLNQEDHA
jgi:signal transduction histidine kinase